VTEPIVGSAEDFTIEVLTELGAKIRHAALDQIAVNDEHLLQDAKELPQLLFYYQAAWCRLNLRAAQTKIKLEQAEANAFVMHKANNLKLGERMPVEEIKARIILEPNVISLTNEHAELEAKAATVKGILEALRQKGYSLQLVASIRGKEEDWLRSSFADRFADHPQREQIASAFNSVIGSNLVR
jgi:hypothetical protein